MSAAFRAAHAKTPGSCGEPGVAVCTCETQAQTSEASGTRAVGFSIDSPAWAVTAAGASVAWT